MKSIYRWRQNLPKPGDLHHWEGFRVIFGRHEHFSSLFKLRMVSTDLYQAYYEDSYHAI